MLLKLLAVLLQAEFADATHNGILSATAQAIGGIKTIDGVVVGNKSVTIDTGVYYTIQGGQAVLNYAPNTYVTCTTSNPATWAFYSNGNPLVAFSDAATQLGLSSSQIDINSTMTFANGNGSITYYQEFVDPTFAFTGPWAAP